MNRLRILLWALLAALVVPAAAHAAAPSVVGFDDLTAGTRVSTQYLGAQHIQFGPPDQWITRPVDAQGRPDPDLPGPIVCATDVAAGQPVVQAPPGLAGLAGLIFCSQDSQENGISYFGTAIHTDIERRGVSFTLRGGEVQGATATVRLFDAAGQLLDTRAVAVPDGVTATVDITRPTPDIATVAVSAAHVGFIHVGVTGLWIDDVAMPSDDVPPPPRFAVSLGNPVAQVVEGSYVDVPVTVARYNGSTGPVNLTVGSLPSGLTAATVTPNPVSGIAPAALRIAAGTHISGDPNHSLTITASAGGGAAGTLVGASTLTQRVTVVPAVVMGDGGDVVAVPGCGSTTINVPLTIRGGFRGKILLQFSRHYQGGTAVGSAPVPANAEVTPTADGDLTVPVTTQAVPDLTTFDVGIFPTGATSSDSTISVLGRTASITRVLPARGSGTSQAAPETTPGGNVFRPDTMRVVGRFPQCNGATFQDDLGRALPIVRTDGVDATGDETLVLKLPADPTTTGVRYISATGTVLAASPDKLFISNYRDDVAANAVNGAPNAGTPDYSWSDFHRDWGGDTADVCFVVCVRSPVAVNFWHGLQDDLKAQSGMCFGYSVTSVRIANGTDKVLSYSPTAVHLWDVPVMEGQLLKNQVVKWQVSQKAGDWAVYRTVLGRDTPTFAQFRDRVMTQLRQKDEFILSLRFNDEGHAVVAYDADITPEGTLRIHTYNPNIPFDAAEDTDLGLHTVNISKSTVYVSPQGEWVGGITTADGTWHGDLSTIEAFDRLPPDNPDITPSAGSVVSYIVDWSAPRTTLALTGLEADGKQVLGTAGVPKAGSGVQVLPNDAGILAPPSYALREGHSYRLTMVGRGGGSYSEGVIGRHGGARIGGVHTASGQKDVVSLDPGTAALGFTGGGGSQTATLELAQDMGSAGQRGAALELTVGGGRSDTASLTQAGITIRHGGPPSNVSATITSVTPAGPSSVTTLPIGLRAGETATVTPGDWSDLNGGLHLTLRRNGRVVRTRTLGTRGATTVRLSAGLSARVLGSGAHRRLLVRGRVAKRGGSPLLVVAVRASNGARRLASRRGGAVRRGRFSVPVSLGKLRVGSLRVTVTLLDEAAGLRSVRRTITVRG